MKGQPEEWDRELMDLFSAVRDETITVEEMERLEALLKVSPKARHAYLRFMQVHALLEQFPPDVEAEGLPKPEASIQLSIRSAALWLAAAAVVLLLAILGLQSLAPDERTSPLATLLLEDDSTQWSHGQDWEEGQRLSPGALGLQQGTAVLRFDGGAEMAIQGPTELELLTAGSARLRRGHVIVRAEDGAEGFTLWTPNDKIVDLGTEFAVRVNPKGNAELHVHEGEVEAANLIIREGEAYRLDGKTPASLELNAARFEDWVRGTKPIPRADLMSVYAGFHYPAGNIPLEKSDRGHGWAGPWRLRTGQEQTRPYSDATPDYLPIVHGQLNVTWPVPGGRLGMLEMPPKGTFYVRDLAEPISMQEDAVWYFSLMVRESFRDEERDNPYEAIRLTFRSSQDYFGESLSFGYGQRFRPRIQVGDGIGFTSPLLVPKEQTSLWVGKVISKRRGEDQIAFRIYGETDPLDYAEPSAWHVVSRDVELSARFDRVLLSSTGDSPRIVDELRIGPTWRSVVPFQP